MFLSMYLMSQSHRRDHITVELQILRGLLKLCFLNSLLATQHTRQVHETLCSDLLDLDLTHLTKNNPIQNETNKKLKTLNHKQPQTPTQSSSLILSFHYPNFTVQGSGGLVSKACVVPMRLISGRPWRYSFSSNTISPYVTSIVPTLRECLTMCQVCRERQRNVAALGLDSCDCGIYFELKGVCESSQPSKEKVASKQCFLKGVRMIGI